MKREDAMSEKTQREPIDVLDVLKLHALSCDADQPILGTLTAGEVVRACEAISKLVDACDDTIQQADDENWRHYNGTDVSRLLQLEDALDNVSPVVSR